MNNKIESLQKQVEKSKRSYRDFEHYSNVFGYDKKGENLRGKRILDIGAGDSDFAKIAETLGAEVVSLDPKYVSTEIITGAPPKYRTPRVVSGLAQSLPFQDESFDEVIASYSLWWMESDLESVLGEMLRVTKRDGLTKISPIYLKTEKKPDESFSLPLNSKLVIVRDRRQNNGCATTLVIPGSSDVEQSGVSALLDQVVFSPTRELSYMSNMINNSLSKVAKKDLNPNIKDGISGWV